MKIIITMAGFGKRFSDVGYNIPKYEIVVKGKTLFEWSMISLSDLKNEEFIFVKREDNRSIKNIDDLIKVCGINRYRVIEIDTITDGQACTALLADSYINDNDDVLIFNIDTFIEPGIIKREHFNIGDGVIHTFSGLGDKWSFAKVDKNDEVVDITEKIRISENASIGLYYFKEWTYFKNTLLKYKDDIVKQYKEAYIAPLYKFLIPKYKIRIIRLSTENVHILGTPEEVLSFERLYNKG
jgi:choline kinase